MQDDHNKNLLVIRITACSLWSLHTSHPGLYLTGFIRIQLWPLDEACVLMAIVHSVAYKRQCTFADNCTVLFPSNTILQTYHRWEAAHYMMTWWWRHCQDIKNNSQAFSLIYREGMKAALKKNYRVQGTLARARLCLGVSYDNVYWQSI